MTVVFYCEKCCGQRIYQTRQKVYYVIYHSCPYGPCLYIHWGKDSVFIKKNAWILSFSSVPILEAFTLSVIQHDL